MGVGTETYAEQNSRQANPNLIVLLLSQMRIKQWTKNLLVFASALFAGNIMQSQTLLLASTAFFSFSLAASTVYIINDIVDVEKDRLHPEKCKRPIAAGVLSLFAATLLGVAAFISSLYLAYKISTIFIGILLFYFVMNICYSFWLKHIVIIDVMIIAAGFVLRAISGAIAVNDQLTPWFILCTLMLSLFLALGKRRYELELFNEDKLRQRKVLAYYSTNLLDQLITIVTAMTITSYALYTATEIHGNKYYMMLTIPLVIYGIFRYLYLIHIENAGGKPEEILLNDRHIFATVILYGISVFLIKSYLTV